MTLCFSTLGCTDYSLPKILSLCREFGISFLEIRGINGELDLTKMPEFTEEKITETKLQLQAANVVPLILGTSCAFHNDEIKQKSLADGKAALKYAQAVGAMGIRVFGNRLTENSAKATANVVESISELCQTARDTNGNVLLEVHGDFNTVKALSPILQEMRNEPHFGLIWDIAHTHQPYGEDWKRFCDAALPFIRHIHIKDVKKNELVLPGDGEIPILPIVRYLLSDGYIGAFSLEWERKWHPELPPIETALKKFIALMKRYDENS